MQVGVPANNKMTHYAILKQTNTTMNYRSVKPNKNKKLSV